MLLLCMAFAHAKVTKINALAALAADGVVAIFTLDDLRDFLTDTVMPVEQPSNALKLSASHRPRGRRSSLCGRANCNGNR